MKRLFFIILLNFILYSANAQDVTLLVHQKPQLQITAETTFFNVILGNKLILGDNVTILGGTAPYATIWSSEAWVKDSIKNSVTVSPTHTTIYTCKVLDSNNCTQEQNFQVNVVFPIQLDLTMTQISCFGSNNGKIAMKISGGALPYIISWNDVDTSRVRSNLGPGIYSVLISDAMGQQKDTSVTLTELSQIEVSLDVSVCEGNAYLFNGMELTEPGVYTGTFQTVSGCDSIVTLNLTVNPNFTKNIDASICQGESYLFAGNELTQTGQYENRLQTINGCDSTIILNLTVNPEYTHTIESAICQNETYLFAGDELSETGQYKDSLKSITGCDSLIILNLTVNPIFNQSIEATICQNETYLFAGNSLAQSGQYTDSVKTLYGCDSIVNLILTVNPTFIQYIEAEICQGETYSFAGIELSQTGSYENKLQRSTGCDSTIVLNLVVKSLPDVPVITQNKNTLISSSIDGNQWFNGLSIISGATNQTLDIVVSGDYAVNVTNSNDCSSSSEFYHAFFVGVPLIATENIVCNVFPNPNNGLFNVEIETEKDEVVIMKLISIDGQTIVKQKLDGVSRKQSVLFGKENLVKGVYTLQIRCGSKIINRKLIVN